MITFASTRFVQRRQKLAAAVRKAHNEREHGIIVVCASFEEERTRFRQNSYFYYLFGITEPGAVGVISLDGSAVLYLPDFGGVRSLWVDEQITFSSDYSLFGLNAIKPLGVAQRGYSSVISFTQDAYKYLIDDISVALKTHGFVGNVCGGGSGDAAVINLMNFLSGHGLADKAFYNCTVFVDELRRVKDQEEILLIQQAIDITIAAHNAAAKTLRPALMEYQLQGVIEAEFLKQGALLSAFPSIIGGGVKSTVLHYVGNNNILEDSNLVVVDIGAEYEYYAADLTRTYPISGRYSDRQREIYNLVLDAQEYAAEVAKPGMFLRNVASREQSIQWLVMEFFKKHNLEKYFPHGIGHYMGLDVHDVGSFLEPLQEGDVITIEPGLYLREEKIGVRIEDDYLVTSNGIRCLSSKLPKKIEDIELLMKR